MLSADWLSAFLPIGVLQSSENWVPLGAGTLFRDGPLVWFVTAQHVVRSAGEHPITVLVPNANSDGVVIVELSSLLQSHGIGWLEDPGNDLAASPFPLSDQFKIKAVGIENCIRMADVLPSMQSYTVGCPYGVRGFDPDSAMPLVMGGVIAGKAPKERLLYTSAPTFQGNSGGPLVVVKPPYDAAGNLYVGPPTVYFAGMILEMALVKAEQRPAGALPPLHLGIARAADVIIDLLRSPSAQGVALQLGLAAK